jgi:hypothetical protein
MIRSEFIFRTTDSYIYCFLSRKAHNFFPEFNIRFYDKNSESYYFFSSTKIRIFFSATLGIKIFFRKKNIPPFKLNGPSLIDVDSGMLTRNNWDNYSICICMVPEMNSDNEHSLTGECVR